MSRFLFRLVLLAGLVSVLWLPAPGFAGSELADRLLSLHASGGSYALQRDTLSGDQFVSDEELQTLRSHSDWRVRQQSEVLLGWRHNRGLFAEVAAMAPVYDRAGRPIFNQQSLRDPDARPALLDRLLHHGDPAPIRAALAGALIGMRPDWDQLNEELLREESMPEVREVLAWSMRRAGARAATGGIALGLADEDPRVRAETCRSVGWRSDGGDHSEGLVLALRDADPQVRAMAARALGWREVADAWKPLLLLLEDDSADVRLHSLRALSRIDSIAVAQLRTLSSLRRDSDPRVMRLAERLLQR